MKVKFCILIPVLIILFFIYSLSRTNQIHSGIIKSGTPFKTGFGATGTNYSDVIPEPLNKLKNTHPRLYITQKSLKVLKKKHAI